MMYRWRSRVVLDESGWLIIAEELWLGSGTGKVSHEVLLCHRQIVGPYKCHRVDKRVVYPGHEPDVKLRR
jgi:hypothetical protein